MNIGKQYTGISSARCGCQRSPFHLHGRSLALSEFPSFDLILLDVTCPPWAENAADERSSYSPAGLLPVKVLCVRKPVCHGKCFEPWTPPQDWRGGVLRRVQALFGRIPWTANEQNLVRMVEKTSAPQYLSRLAVNCKHCPLSATRLIISGPPESVNSLLLKSCPPSPSAEKEKSERHYMRYMLSKINALRVATPAA